MKARSVMKHRATIERRSTASDTGGGFTESWVPVAASTPCYAWALSGQMVLLSERPGVEQSRLVLMPRATDVQVGDRLTNITNRKGTELLSGPLNVDAVQERPDHLQLTTRRIL